MRVETLLSICKVFGITPDDILTEENISMKERQKNMLEHLESCTPKEKEVALKLLSVYFDFLTINEKI